MFRQNVLTESPCHASPEASLQLLYDVIFSRLVKKLISNQKKYHGLSTDLLGQQSNTPEPELSKFLIKCS